MINKSNIIKTVCKALGYTYNQLAEQIGYSESAIKMALQKEQISEPMQKAIELYLKTIKREDLVEQVQDEIIEEENLVEKVCNEFNITQKKLAELIDVSTPTINRWSSNPSEMPKMAISTLKLMIENKELNENLEKIKILNELKEIDFASLSYEQLKNIKTIIDN